MKLGSTDGPWAVDRSAKGRGPRRPGKYQAVCHRGRGSSPESRYPLVGRRAGVKMGRAARRRRGVLGRWRPCLSLAPGPDSRVAHCCLEHAGQSFGVPTEPPGSPSATRCGEEDGGVPAGQQVEVDDHEQIVERVAAIDVAKASGMVCIRVPHPAKPGQRVTKVWQVPATTNAIIELAEQLAGQGIQRVVVESTSDYWRPFVYLLEARGLMVWLVNARDVKHLPGRPKTDKLDAVWLAKLNERGMLRPSFVPPVQIRRLRDYTRLRCDLTAERGRQVQRL